MTITKDEVLSQSTAYATAAYTATMEQRSSQLDTAAASANQLYIQAANQYAQAAGSIGREAALRQALNSMAEKGVSVSTYTRKDGTVVTTPVDVGVRRMITDQLRQRGIQQVVGLAADIGRKYVEVSITANCRESHMAWQGGIYSLDATDDTYPYFYDACDYGDPVDGIGGYNCGHEVHIYREETGRTFTDPLEGTGYTTEEVRALTTQQRVLENSIRKAKRQVSTLKAAGLTTTAENARLRVYRQQLSELVSEHASVLTDVGSYRTGVNRTQAGLLRQLIASMRGTRAEESGAWAESLSWLRQSFEVNSIEYVEVLRGKMLSDSDIISKLGKKDATEGSCVSQAIAYVANKMGLDVTDYRGGSSCEYFATHLSDILEEIGASTREFTQKLNDTKLWNTAKNDIIEGKLYIFERVGIGSDGHAAIVKKEGSKYYYLELQPSAFNGSSGWHLFGRNTITERFGGTTGNVRKERTVRLYDMSDIDEETFRQLCGYINTNEG